tara:strand:+ start:51 stop:623 length:573 start_codon:yes stop_codon:yes gene_type:complete
VFKNIFSSYLFVDECKSELTLLKNHILKLKSKDSTGRKRSNKGGWQSKSFEKVNSANKEIFEELNKAAQYIKEKLDFSRKIKLLNYWYNINYKNCFNIPHLHASNNIIISGVLYIQTSKNCGKIIFRRHNQVFSMLYDERINNYNEYNSSTFSIAPQTKRFLLFPSDLEHYVESNLDETERISLSFNFGT